MIVQELFTGYLFLASQDDYSWLCKIFISRLQLSSGLIIRPHLSKATYKTSILQKLFAGSLFPTSSNAYSWLHKMFISWISLSSSLAVRPRHSDVAYKTSIVWELYAGYLFLALSDTYSSPLTIVKLDYKTSSFASLKHLIIQDEPPTWYLFLSWRCLVMQDDCAYASSLKFSLS